MASVIYNVCVCVCVYVHTMYVCMYVCMYVGRYACNMYIGMYVCMYIRTYLCMYYVSMYVRMCIGISVCAYVYRYVCVYMYVYVCMYACMYEWKRERLSGCRPTFMQMYPSACVCLFVLCICQFILPITYLVPIMLVLTVVTNCLWSTDFEARHSGWSPKKTECCNQTFLLQNTNTTPDHALLWNMAMWMLFLISWNVYWGYILNPSLLSCNICNL